MIITQGTKDFALGLYERVFGYNPLEEQKKNEAKLAKERQKAEEERLQLLAALHREEEERQRLHATTIFNLHHIAKMSAAEIALIVNMEPETIEAIIVNHSGE